MTHEQKPEIVSFRAREDQIETMTVHYMEAGFPVNAARRLAKDGVAEAEARGAADQRRKDAEGIRCLGWLATDFQSGHALGVALETDSEQVDSPSCGTICWEPLWTRPSNVTALKERIKELEGENERLKKPEWVCDEESSYESARDALECEQPSAFEVRKFTACRSVGEVWAFLDENFFAHEFATEIEAKNAAAAIREGGEK